jgi:cell wall-associated NlpC family hydrolase
VAGIALAGAGVERARAETPAQRIARLKSQAAAVQASIDRMNDQVETIVEQYNSNRVALQATLDRQRDATRRLEQASKRLATATEVMGDRVRAMYMNGPVSGLEQMLGVRSVTDAVTIGQYQQSASASDAETIAEVRQLRTQLESVSAQLGEQRREQERLQAKLDSQRRDIQRRLADQEAFMSRLSADVKRAVAEERQRQEELRRQELARKLAAERAAAAEAARAAAARQRASAAASSSAPGSSGGDSSPALSGGGGSAGRQAVAYARAQLGKPYIWGAEGPGGYDCSGLTMMAWRSAGVSIPRVSGAQYGIGRHIDSMSALEAGDLVFFGSPIHHVGLYVGNGTMIEAPFTGASVRYHSINRPDYAGATRPTG